MCESVSLVGCAREGKHETLMCVGVGGREVWDQQRDKVVVSYCWVGTWWARMVAGWVWVWARDTGGSFACSCGCGGGGGCG